MKRHYQQKCVIDMRVLLIVLVGFWLCAAILMGCDRDHWPKPIKAEHGVEGILKEQEVRMPRRPENRSRRRKRPKRLSRRDDRLPASVRGYDREWGTLREWHINQYPLCEHCEAKGKVVAAREVDHIVPFQGRSDPLRLDGTNLQSLCRSCHAKKTAAVG